MATASRPFTDKVVVFGPLPPPYGGVAIHVEQLVAHLRARGVRAPVLTFSGGDPPSGVRHLGPPRRSRPMWLAKLLAAAGPRGIVHNHTHLAVYPTPRALEPLRAIRTVARLRWVETVHDETFITRFPELPASRRETAVRFLSGATRLITTNASLRDFLVDVGVPAGRIVVGAPLLPPVGPVADLPSAAAAFAAGHDPVIAWSGAMYDLYDLTTLAAALGSIRASRPRAGVIAVVAGFADDGAYEARVRSTLGHLLEHVAIVRDVPNDAARAIFAAADVVVRGPQRESFGLTRAEALMGGTSVVGTPTGATEHVIPYTHGDTDSLVAGIDAALGPEGAETVAVGGEYYRAVAASALEAILDVYEDLGLKVT